LIGAVSTTKLPVVALELEGIGMTREAVLAAATRTGKLIVMYHTEGSGFADDTTRRFRLDVSSNLCSRMGEMACLSRPQETRGR